MSTTWLITGASSGFGRGLTQTLLARGDRVAATVRRADALADLQAAHGNALTVLQLDVRDTAAVQAVVAQAFAALGRIDVVISNAGYGTLGAAEAATDAQVRALIDTNLIGSISVIQAALPHLRRQGGGHVVQVSSEGGQIAYPGFSLYHASKWGIEGYVEAVRQEVAGFGIQFTLAEPGPARTNFGAALERTALPPDYANTPVDALLRALDDGSWVITGDPQRMVDAMIACTEQTPPPLRLVMGTAAYHAIHAALSSRLAALEAQRAIAFSTDAPATAH
ncbi:SDR family oxidoreductase [Xanthomonas campestris]|uniref:SDR family oxidoreductase n=1 Tax=Xanthomonas campestris TaxID=339 RepID=UPI00138FC55D|nr:SDR family oxidoreductase [Xanthomonas campestris]MCF8828465.1 SDR family oxidoreductase [Xanthomonas campestris pv. raphani]MEA9840265.1 SDR family oxidoreductase [Xanthomonas campestris pv. raphani]MEA9877525.1 SDR family oxidoreductase [Xanthomonas campestris pv. raphani]MEA9892359.1 SDR family oxidoreductase [Xanthomonas campestris pv. raphani]MEA9935378.1 SDR family oxidoreductase [Xanthomonas campestris pv. raphani]